MSDNIITAFSVPTSYHIDTEKIKTTDDIITLVRVMFNDITVNDATPGIEKVVYLFTDEDIEKYEEKERQYKKRGGGE